MSSNKDITMSEIKQVVAVAITHFNVNKYIDSFTDRELISLCKNADPDIFTDASVADNAIIQENFDWNRVRPKRLARMMARAIDLGYFGLLNLMDTKEMKLHVKDLRHLLRRKPEAIERFNIDLKKLGDIESLILLELGKDYFIERIDVKKKRFTFAQQYSICQAYDFSRKVMLLFDCKKFDGFQTKEIIKRTGHDNIDIIDLTNPKIVDWIDLLQEMPDMYQYCDLSKFRNVPIAELISLAVASNSDEVYDRIKTGNLSEVSPFGWEKLMTHRSELFKDVCDYGKLDALNKRNVLTSNPHLITLIEQKKTQSM